ncbi:MAG TPA: pseudouridine synthase [Polyangiaceae bacterium]|nr:pseudouridine synthase [Polyangiaceae bacterium]
MSAALVRLQVATTAQGLRVDQGLALLLPELSRRRAQRLIEEGRVWLDGRPTRKGDLLRAGQVLEVDLDDDGAAHPTGELTLRLLSETVDWVAIDKPAGLPSAALPGRATRTAASALLASYPEMAGVGYGPREPGLIHRLDTQTSGVLLAARTQHAFTCLRAALRDGALDKSYWAIVTSPPPREHGEVTAPLLPDPQDRRRVKVAAEGTAAHTSYRILGRGQSLILIEAHASHAYRHQVRAHLAHLGCPLWGDPLYGGLGAGPRHALHARAVSGQVELGPSSGPAQLHVTAPLADDLQELLEADGLTPPRW